MQVKQLMTTDVFMVTPSDSLRDAALAMARHDIGSLPVHDGDHLVGMVTDRDIAVRGIAQGLGPDAKVGDVMSAEVLYCFEDQDSHEVARNMADIQVRRLPVLNRAKRLVGILALGDIAVRDQPSAGEAISGISRSGGAHSQAAEHAA